MGNANTGAGWGGKTNATGDRLKETCAAAFEDLRRCKAELNLGENERYSIKGYNGECDTSEYQLKRCLAFAVDPVNARILYDSSRPRERRLQANKELQKAIADSGVHRH